MSRWLSGPSSASRMRQFKRGSRAARWQGCGAAPRWLRWGDRAGPRPPAGRDRWSARTCCPCRVRLADGDVAAEHLRQALGDGQPQPGAAELAGGRGVGLLEGLEEVLDLLRRSCRCPYRRLRKRSFGSGSSRSARRTTIRTPPVSVNLMALPTRFSRICRRRAGSVKMVSGTGPANSSFKPSPLPSARTRISETTSATTAAGRAGLPLDLEFSGFDLREVEDVVDDGQEVVAVAADDVEGLQVFGIVQLPGQDVGVAQDGRHGRADLVAHVGQELALGAGRRLRRLHRVPPWPASGFPGRRCTGLLQFGFFRSVISRTIPMA